MRGTRWPVWQRVVLGAVLAAFVAVVVISSLGGSRQQRLADDWEAALATWEEQARDLPEVPALADVVDGSGREAAVDGPEAVDRVNDVCARVNSFGEAVAERSAPPGAPDGLDPEAPQAATALARHERDRSAWQDLESASAQPLGAVRTFCGSYPAVMVAAAAEADARERLAAGEVGTGEGSAGDDLLASLRARADALSTSCVVAEAAAWCAAEATRARDLLEVEQRWVDALRSGDRSAAADAAAEADEVRERPLPDDVVDLGLGEDPDEVAASVVDLVAASDDALAAARAALLEAVAGS